MLVTDAEMRELEARLRPREARRNLIVGYIAAVLLFVTFVPDIVAGVATAAGTLCGILGL